MSSEILKSDWNEVAGELKMRFGKLTDEDLRFEQGQEKELLQKIARKLDRSEEQLLELIAKF